MDTGTLLYALSSCMELSGERVAPRERWVDAAIADGPREFSLRSVGNAERSDLTPSLTKV